MAHRRTWASASGLLAGYCGLAGATGIAVAVGGARRPSLALAILAVAVLLLATRAKALAAAGLGFMAWLFYAGFIAGRHGNLAWHGSDDVWWLGVLAGSAFLGVTLSWLAATLGGSQRAGNQRARNQRARNHPAGNQRAGKHLTGNGPAGGPRGDTQRAGVISLAEARISRRG